MDTTIKLEKIEMDALNIISNINCSGITCSKCPLKVDYTDYRICIKCACQRLLEDYRNKE